MYKPDLRRPRKRWLLLGAVTGALALAVPIAWAAFTDVPPSNPFYADVNAIQGAGITAGCGGGNFCPNDNITRQAEAAFVHRAAGRAGVALGAPILVPVGSGTEVAALTVTVGGAANQTQFVKVDAAATTWITSTTGCPCQTFFLIRRDGGEDSIEHYTNNTFVGSSGFGLDSAAATQVYRVPSGTSQTFRLLAFNQDGTGTVAAYGELSAATAPFSNTGTSTFTTSQTARRASVTKPTAKRVK